MSKQYASAGLYTPGTECNGGGRFYENFGAAFHCCQLPSQDEYELPLGVGWRCGECQVPWCWMGSKWLKGIV